MTLHVTARRPWHIFLWGACSLSLCCDLDSWAKAWAVCRQGQSSFGDAGVFVEKLVQQAHHIEAQIFGDGHGQVRRASEHTLVSSMTML